MSTEESLKSGYLYVLAHPSDPDLYKIGVTILDPKKRLAQHNSQFEEYAGKIVKATGQKWELKTYIDVVDPYWAEKVFWSATPLADIPYRGGVEVFKMKWEWVQNGLDEARIAGVRPPPPPRLTAVRNGEWMLKQLEGSGITMIGRYGGLLRGMEFQCEKGHVFKESPGVLAYRKSCPCCVDWNWSRGPKAGLRTSLR
jgi:hypothetical protein